MTSVLRPAARGPLLRSLPLFTLVSLLGLGCEPAPEAPIDGGPPDAGEPDCTFPAPRLGDSPEALALAASAGRCGQPDYAWVDDAALGEVRARRTLGHVTRSLLTNALTSQGITPGRPFELDVVVDQITYVTQDRGVLVEATAAVSYPTRGFPDAGPRPILLLLHGTTGFADACSPSTDLGGQVLAAMFASWGFMVVAPDYIGLRGDGTPTGFLHPYTVGQPTAMASLDAVRALGRLLPSERGGSCVEPRVLVMGPSQGGHAALWVDRLAPLYAPELPLAGVVATVAPADILAEAARAADILVPATGNTVSVLGAASQWYGLEARLSEVLLSPWDVELVPALEASCTDAAPPTPTLTSTDEIFQPLLVDAARGGTLGELEPWGCIFRENGLPTTSIPRIAPDPSDYGILLVLGGVDELVDTPIEREAYRGACEAGLPIAAIECDGADHVGATFWAMPEILDFLDARAAGEAFVRPATCEPPAAVTCSASPTP